VWNAAEAIAEAREQRDGRQQGPAIVVPIGAHVRRIRPDEKKRDPAAMVYLGHLLEKQGVQLVIEALPLILERERRARLVIIGDGPHGQALRDLAQARGVAAAVSFEGYSDDHEAIEERLLECSIGVAPYAPDP